MVMWLVLLMIILGAILLAWKAITAGPKDKCRYEEYEKWKEGKRKNGHETDDFV